MDHHCAFTGSCIGLGNVKAFILFCLYTMFQSVMGALLILRYAIQNGLEEAVYLSPIKGILMIQTKFLREQISERFGIARDTMGLWPIDSDGILIYPAKLLEFDPSLYYEVDNFLYVANIGVVIFIAAMMYGVITNIK